MWLFLGLCFGIPIYGLLKVIIANPQPIYYIFHIRKEIQKSKLIREIYEIEKTEGINFMNKWLL